MKKTICSDLDGSDLDGSDLDGKNDGIYYIHRVGRTSISLFSHNPVW